MSTTVTDVTFPENQFGSLIAREAVYMVLQHLKLNKAPTRITAAQDFFDEIIKDEHEGDLDGIQAEMVSSAKWVLMVEYIPMLGLAVYDNMTDTCTFYNATVDAKSIPSYRQAFEAVRLRLYEEKKSNDLYDAIGTTRVAPSVDANVLHIIHYGTTQTWADDGWSLCKLCFLTQDETGERGLIPLPSHGIQSNQRA